MSNYLENLVERTLHGQFPIQPRLPSLFEPPALYEVGGVDLAGTEIREEIAAEPADRPNVEGRPRRETRSKQPGRTPERQQAAAEFPLVEQEETSTAPARQPLAQARRLEAAENPPAQEDSPRPGRLKPAGPMEPPEIETVRADTVRPVTEIRQIITNIFNRESEPDTASERQPKVPETPGRQVEPRKPITPEVKQTVVPSNIRPVTAADQNGTEPGKTPAETAEKAPTIRVHIGRVEVRAVPSAPTPAPPSSKPSPQPKAMTLEEYMNRRRENRR